MYVLAAYYHHMTDELDPLLHASLAATTDIERAELGARIARVPDVIAKLALHLRSTEWATRRLAMHFVTRLAPPPAELTPAIVAILHSPLSTDPFGEETVLGLVIAGAIASHITAQRSRVEARLAWIERAIAIGSDEVADHPGEPTQFEVRAGVVQKLARDTLAKIDAAIVAAREAYATLVATIADRFALAAGDGIVMVELAAARSPERYAYAAALWQAIARAFPATSPNRRAALEHALQALRADASGATAGGEGLARMADVHALEHEIAALPVPAAP